MVKKLNVCSILDLQTRIKLESSTWTLGDWLYRAGFFTLFEIFMEGTRIAGFLTRNEVA